MSWLLKKKKIILYLNIIILFLLHLHLYYYYYYDYNIYNIKSNFLSISSYYFYYFLIYFYISPCIAFYFPTSSAIRSNLHPKWSTSFLNICVSGVPSMIACNFFVWSLNMTMCLRNSRAEDKILGSICWLSSNKSYFLFSKLCL